jgi:hypothetical protein|tara:strand:- start:618 stop:809 length:192 start_codon:yes stop_codon:yes gene_type:complete
MSGFPAARQNQVLLLRQQFPGCKHVPRENQIHCVGSKLPLAANSLNGGDEPDVSFADGFQSVC